MSKEEQIESAIYLTPELRIIRLDKYCLALQSLIECSSKKDNYKYNKWDTIGYHGTIIDAFKQAQREILCDRLFENELKSIEEIKGKITDLEKQVVDIVKKSVVNI